jgi:hypothetical protein
LCVGGFELLFLLDALGLDLDGPLHIAFPNQTLGDSLKDRRTC